MIWNFKPNMRSYRFVGHKVSAQILVFAFLLIVCDLEMLNLAALSLL